MKFDHIGVVVPSLARGREHLNGIFGIQRWTIEFADEINGVYVQFGLDSSELCYEIVAPLGENSPVQRTLAVRDRILNHVAYLVPDLDQSAIQLRANRCLPAGSPNPAIAYGGSRIQFFISPLKFIVELIEAPNHKHIYLASSEIL